MLNNLTVPPPYIYLYVEQQKEPHRKEKSWLKFNKLDSLYFSFRIL